MAGPLPPPLNGPAIKKITIVLCHISRPLPSLPPPVTRTPRVLVSTICLCNYMSEYECMYMYTAVLLPQVYTICIVYNVRIYVHYLVRIQLPFCHCLHTRRDIVILNWKKLANSGGLFHFALFKLSFAMKIHYFVKIIHHYKRYIIFSGQRGLNAHFKLTSIYLQQKYQIKEKS